MRSRSPVDLSTETRYRDGILKETINRGSGSGSTRLGSLRANNIAILARFPAGRSESRKKQHKRLIKTKEKPVTFLEVRSGTAHVPDYKIIFSHPAHVNKLPIHRSLPVITRRTRPVRNHLRFLFLPKTSNNPCKCTLNH